MKSILNAVQKQNIPIKPTIVILDDKRITTVNKDGAPIRAYWVKT